MKKIFVLVPVIICLTACISNITRYWNGGGFFAWSVQKDKAWSECSHELQDELESENITTLMRNCMNRKGFRLNVNLVSEEVDNPYLSEFNKIWHPKDETDNPSLPVIM